MSEEKINRRKTHSALFKKNDPRINRKGKPLQPAKIEDIRNEVRHLLMDFFHKFFKSNYEDCVAVLNSKTLSVGETIALRFLLLSAGPNATPAHIQTVCKLFGLKMEHDTQVNIQNNINLSLEEMVVEANKPVLQSPNLALDKSIVDVVDAPKPKKVGHQMMLRNTLEKIKK